VQAATRRRPYHRGGHRCLEPRSQLGGVGRGGPRGRRVVAAAAAALAISTGAAALQGLTFVPNSAQLELTLPLSAQLKLTVSPMSPNVTRGRGPRVLKLSSNVSDLSRRSSS